MSTRNRKGREVPYTAPLWPAALLAIGIGAACTGALLWALAGLWVVVRAHEGLALAGLLGLAWLLWPRRRRGRR